MSHPVGEGRISAGVAPYVTLPDQQAHIRSQLNVNLGVKNAQRRQIDLIPIKSIMYLVIMSTILFIGGIGGPELLIVLFIAVFLFGANKLPKLARSSGQAIGEFQKGREEIEEDIRRSAREAKEGVSAEADGDEADGDEADIDALDTDDALDGDGKSPEANPA